MSLQKILSAAAAAFLLIAGQAHALQISNPDEVGPGALVQTFADAATYDSSLPRVQIGTSLGVDLGVIGINGPLLFGAPFGAWSLGSNGDWTSALNFVGIDSAGNATDQGAYPDDALYPSIRFDFGTQTVQSIGAFMNYDPDFVYGGGQPLPIYIAAYDINGVELDSYFLPISTPGAINAGSFFGISTQGALISSFEISGPYAVATNLTFSAPIPEPSTYALMAAGLLMLGAVVRRQRRRG